MVLVPFAASGVYVVPADVDAIEGTLFAAGAGGAGGGGGFTAASGGGGGGGQGGDSGGMINFFLRVVPGETLTITVGLGGAGGLGGAAGADGAESAAGQDTVISGSLGTVTVPSACGIVQLGAGAGTRSKRRQLQRRRSPVVRARRRRYSAPAASICGWVLEIA